VGSNGRVDFEPPPIDNFDYEGLTFGSEWTHLFSTVLLSGTDDLGASGQSYIRTYLPSAGGIRYAELYFDCADKCFKLAVNGATVLTSAPRALLGGARVYFAVRQFDGRLHVSISDGYGVEHVAGGVAGQLVAQSGAIRSGNITGSSVAAQVYLQDVFFEECALTNKEIEQRFYEATLK
jgi:hypothetical protein